MIRQEAWDLVRRAEKCEFSTDDKTNMVKEFVVRMEFPVGLKYAHALCETIDSIIKKKTSDTNTCYKNISKKVHGQTRHRTRDIRVITNAYTVRDDCVGNVIYGIYNFRYLDRIGNCMKLLFIIPHDYQYAVLAVYTDKNIRHASYAMEPRDDDPEWWMRTLRHEIYISLKTIGFQFDNVIDRTKYERLDLV